MRPDGPAARRGRRRLALLALVFALPALLASLLYFGGWRSGSGANRGVLVEPPRPLADVALAGLEGEPRRFSSLYGKWMLVYFGPAGCDTACQRSLYTMRQVHAAQGKEAERVQRVFVVTDAAARDRLRETLRDYPGMAVLAGPPEAVAALARQFAAPGAETPEASGRIHLVDPLGNFMMHYGPEADPNGLRKDLARLLRLSRIG